MGEPHYVNAAVLLSPAGFHEDTSLTIKVIAWLFDKFISKTTSHIALPDLMIELVQKLHKDLTLLPATRDLITKLTEFLVGGDPKTALA